MHCSGDSIRFCFESASFSEFDKFQNDKGSRDDITSSLSHYAAVFRSAFQFAFDVGLLMGRSIVTVTVCFHWDRTLAATE